MGEGSDVRLETAAVAASSSPKRSCHCKGSRRWLPRSCTTVSLSLRRARMLTKVVSTQVILEFPMLRAERWPRRSLAIRQARLSDGDALPNLCPWAFSAVAFPAIPGRCKRTSGWELGRALAANGRDTLTLLLTSTAEDRETVIGEARVALSCAKRAGEFSMSIADD